MGWITRTGTYSTLLDGFVRCSSKVVKYSNGNYGPCTVGSGEANFTITEIPANATVTSATVGFHTSSPSHGYDEANTTCCGINLPAGQYNKDLTVNGMSLFYDGSSYTNVMGNFAIPFTFQLGYPEPWDNGKSVSMEFTNITVTANYTYQEWQDDPSPDPQTPTTYYGTIGGTADNFQLRSSWTRSANGSETTPTVATAQKSFSVEIPTGATVTSALLYVTCKNSVCGPRVLKVALGQTEKNLNKNFSNIVNFTSQITQTGTYTFTFTFQEWGGCLLTTGSHYGVMQFENISLEVKYQYTATEESHDPADIEPEEDYSSLIGTTESTGICLYSADVTDFSDNGYGILRPTRCVVTEEAAGMYEAEMQLPMAEAGGLWAYITVECILKIPVPVITLDAFRMAGAEYWKVGASPAPVTSRVPTIQRVANLSGLPSWSSSMVVRKGTKVKYNNQAWQYTGFVFLQPDGTYSTVGGGTPGSSGSWRNVTSYGTKENSGETLETLLPNTIFTMIEDLVGTDFMRVQTPSGNVGYMKKNLASYYSEPSADVSTRTIRNQCFRIYRIEKDSTTRMMTVSARHLSYDYNNTILGRCEAQGVSVPTAIQMIKEAATTEDNRQIFTNIDDQTVNLDCSWDNGTSALINPDTGIVPQLQAKLIRDNHDFFIFEDEHDNNGYMITYSKNMRSIRWTIDTTDMCTRVFPHCKDAEDGDLILPEQCVDSDKINDYPKIYVESLAVNAKEGQKGTVDGTEIPELTKENCYTLMRQAAADRFTVDHSDEPDIEIDIDLVELRTTEEYKSYEGVERLYMYDTVTVSHPLIGIGTDVYMTGYTYDAILKRYETIKLTNAIRRFSESVSSYQLKDNSIRFEKLSSTAVDRLRN